MAKFLIQTINRQVKHDFSFALIESIDYQNWLNKGVHDYYLTGDLLEHDYSQFIPSGSIQFIEKFLGIYHDIHNIKPINIPEQLLNIRFTKRSCEILDKDRINLNGTEKFIKSMQRLKGFTGVVNAINEDFLSGDYLVSDLINIESEWRSFVYDGQLVGLQNYSGDFTLFPDINFIKSCIAAYTECPPAYTLDVGVNSKDGTFVIEVHNFYSCGLYGFNDSKILPQMFIRSFNHLLKKKI